MKNIWFKGIPKDEEEQRIKELLSYRNAFDALKEVLVTLEEKSSTRADYDSPSWAFKQADRNGANRMLRSIIDIITIEKDDHA